MEEKLDARPHKLELLNREKGSVTVDIEGEFESFSYSCNESHRKSQESFFGRLFR